MIQSAYRTPHAMTSSPGGRTTPDLQYHCTKLSTDCEAESYRVPLRRSLTNCQTRFLRWSRPACRLREISWASVVIDHSSSLWRKILWCPNSSRNHTTVEITCSIRHSCPITAMRMSVLISPTCKVMTMELSFRAVQTSSDPQEHGVELYLWDGRVTPSDGPPSQNLWRNGRRNWRRKSVSSDVSSDYCR